MVARGDYGVEAGVARVPLMQKDTIRRATQAGKLVITATQMLESMIHAPEPTRAEAADVANAVIDGSSAVMLSAETSVGEYPVEAVRAMAEIAEAAEEAPVIHGRARATSSRQPPARRSCTPPSSSPTSSTPSRSSSRPRPAARRARARSTADSGRSSRSRTTAGVADQLTLEWGVYPTTMDVAESVDDLIEAALLAARDVAGPPERRARRPHRRPARPARRARPT